MNKDFLDEHGLLEILHSERPISTRLSNRLTFISVHHRLDFWVSEPKENLDFLNALLVSLARRPGRAIRPSPCSRLLTCAAQQVQATNGLP